MTAIYLEKLTWPQAEKHLGDDPVLVVPLGAALKEHGHHLPLNNDKLMALHLTSELGKRLDIVVAPVVETCFYPAFASYPGSVSLRFETAEAVVFETCVGLAKFGVRKIYVLNTGVSTLKVLACVKGKLAEALPQLKFGYTDFKNAVDTASSEIREQPGGGHADEVETSIMMHIAPHIVAMEKAKPDYHGDAPGPLVRNVDDIKDGQGVYSPTGAWGDPTLASCEKGKFIVDKLLEWIERDVREISQVS